MPIALTDERRQLADVASAFLADRHALAAARDLLEAEVESLPPFWDELVSMGWLGLHLPEDVGGSGYGLDELAVVLEALGAAAAPGPFLPTVIASAIIDAVGSDVQRKAHLPGLADGTTLGAVALGGSVDPWRRRETRRRCRPRPRRRPCRPVRGAHRRRPRPGARHVGRPSSPSTASTRRAASPGWRLDGVVVGDDEVVPDGAATAVALARSLAAAEAAGGAGGDPPDGARLRQGARAVRAHDRHLPGRQAPPRQHARRRRARRRRGVGRGPSRRPRSARRPRRCRRRQRRPSRRTGGAPRRASSCWAGSASRGSTTPTSTSVAPGCWRRSSTMARRATSPPSSRAGRRRTRASSCRPRRRPTGPRSGRSRRRYDALPAGERLPALIESGYCMPHWPAPWGRSAGAVEQLVIDEELPDVERPDLGIGTWVLLTLIQHGTPEQLERWIRPSLDGDLYWCQLFSEPDAGSDAAAIQTRATRVDGGWLVNGQKVWTSGAQRSNMGLATVRTDPDAPKHAGVSTFAIDMAAHGVEVRPLREITGESLFSEVFFTDVFVPDDDVVGDDRPRVDRRPGHARQRAGVDRRQPEQPSQHRRRRARGRRGALRARRPSRRDRGREGPRRVARHVGVEPTSGDARRDRRRTGTGGRGHEAAVGRARPAGQLARPPDRRRVRDRRR